MPATTGVPAIKSVQVLRLKPVGRLPSVGRWEALAAANPLNKGDAQVLAEVRGELASAK